MKMQHKENGNIINLENKLDPNIKKIKIKIILYNEGNILDSKNAIQLKNEIENIMGPENSIVISELKTNDSMQTKGNNQSQYILEISEKKVLNKVIDHLCAWQKKDAETRHIEINIAVGRTKELNFEMSCRNPKYEQRLRKAINSLWK